ncbi:MAG: hypothetical protein SOY97_05895 [Candidatus Metalachnospira sp.]|nr:hypothetical protein [Candidatus Metalachnospira sp.]
MASNVEEMENKFNVVFDGMTEEVNKWAEDYAAAIGRNKNTIKEYLADNQNMFVGMGMTREEGANLSEQMVKLGLDLASFNNISEDQAINSLSKALMGETESAKTLGAVLNENTLKTAMHTMGIKKNFDALTESEKMQVRYQAILMQSTDAVGDCERSLDSFVGRKAQFTSTFENIKETIGGMILPLATFALTIGTTVLGRVKDFVNFIKDTAIPAIRDYFAPIVDKLSAIFSKIGTSISANLTPYLSQIGQVLSEIGVKFNDVLNTYIVPFVNDFISMVTKLYNENKDKFQLIGQFVGAVFEVIIKVLKGFADFCESYIYPVIVWFTNIIRTNMSTVKEIFQSVINIITGILKLFTAVLKGDWKSAWEAVKEIVRAGKDFVVNCFELLKSSIGDLIGKIKDKIAEKFGEAVDKVKEIGENIIKGLWEGISNMGEWVAEKIRGFGDGVLQALKDFFDIKSPSRVMRDQVGKNLALGVAEGITKNKKKASKAAEKMASDILDAAKKRIETYQVYNDMALADEVDYWEEIRKTIKEGTSAKIEADKIYFEKKKSLDENLKTLDDEYEANYKTVSEKLIDDISSLEEAYNSSFESKRDGLISSMNLFEAYEEKEAQGTEALFANLQSQVDALNDYSESIDNLKDRGISEDFITTLESMGVSAVGQIKELASMSNKELDNYVSLWEEKMNLASSIAAEELSPLREETDKQIQGLIKDANSQLSDYLLQYQQGYSDLGIMLENTSAILGSDDIDTQPVSDFANNLINTFGVMAENVNIKTENMNASTSEKFTAIKDNVTEAMSDSLNVVKKYLADMKTAFESFTAHLKLPHISIHGSWDLEGGYAPWYSVEWYKKGAILNQPTAFGINPMTGAAMVGGEAGPEAVAPIDTLMNYVKTAVKEETTGTTYYLERLISMLSEFFPSVISNMDRNIVLSDGTLVGAMTPQIDKTLGEINKLRGRGQ